MSWCVPEFGSMVCDIIYRNGKTKPESVNMDILWEKLESWFYDNYMHNETYEEQAKGLFATVTEFINGDLSLLETLLRKYRRVADGINSSRKFTFAV